MATGRTVRLGFVADGGPEMGDRHDQDLRGEVAALRAALERLDGEVSQLRRENEALRARHPEAQVDRGDNARRDEADAEGEADETAHSRRGVLRLAGVGLAGAVAGSVAGAGSAAAADNDPVRAGRFNYATRSTFLRGGTPPAIEELPPLLTTSTVPVLAAAGGIIGVHGEGTQWGLLGQGAFAGVMSFGIDYGYAVSASRRADYKFSLHNPGVGPKIAPPLRTDAHFIGELDADGDGNLWFCVASGTPGTWKKIAGPGADPTPPAPPPPQGLFTPIDPSRVYDSRAAAPSPGRLTSGDARTISVADSRNLDSGAVLTADIVPSGARAVSCNLSVVATTGSGFLAVNPGGDSTVRAAAVNWFGPGQILNNGIIVKLDAARRLTVVAGGGGSADFVVDVTGYVV